MSAELIEKNTARCGNCERCGEEILDVVKGPMGISHKIRPWCQRTGRDVQYDNLCDWHERKPSQES